MNLPPILMHDRVIANVEWNTAEVTDDTSIRAAKKALVTYMRKKHPGKKYRIIKTFSDRGRKAAFLAVPLDG